MLRLLRSTRLAAIALLTLGSIGSPPAADAHGDGERYDVRVRRTTFGIPHIKARDWGSLGYGSGYAFARDNLCVLARDIIEAQGELSRFFGPDGGNLDSDLFYTYWTTDEVAERFRAASRKDFQDLVRGYAAPQLAYSFDDTEVTVLIGIGGFAWSEVDVTDPPLPPIFAAGVLGSLVARWPLFERTRGELGIRLPFVLWRSFNPPTSLFPLTVMATAGLTFAPFEWFDD